MCYNSDSLWPEYNVPSFYSDFLSFNNCLIQFSGRNKANVWQWSWHTRTKLKMFPLVLHQFHMCCALNHVFIHPATCQTRWKHILRQCSSYTHMCLLPLTLSAWDRHRWLTHGYHASTFPELLLLELIHHSDRIF